MKISVTAPNERNILLRLPSGLIFNRLTAYVAAAFLKKYAFPLNGSQIHALLAAMKDIRRENGGWTLVEIHTLDGTNVEIVV